MKNKSMHFNPKSIVCPSCSRRMNLAGPGRASGCIAYLCNTCPDTQRVKELWRGRVVRTVARDFGFVELTGGNYKPVHFWTTTYVSVVSGVSEIEASPRIGDKVLVALKSAEAATKVWALSTKKTTGPKVADPNIHVRQVGVITKLGACDWGWISAYKSGKQLFLHRSQWKGVSAMIPGTEVTFVERMTPRGAAAYEVTPTNGQRSRY